MDRDFDHALEQAKLEALRQFAYGAGHEINNPLANISARAQTLLRDERDPERRRLLAAINAQALRAHEMIADLMLFARPPRPKLAECDLVALLRAVHGELASQAQSQGSRFELKLPNEPAPARIDPTQIAVAARSLCINALEALVQGGSLELSLERRGQPPGELCIRVADDGPGIPAAARPHIFDPYYSGREAGRGLGLGLCKAWRIATLHGGAIEVGDPPRGAELTLVLPTGNGV